MNQTAELMGMKTKKTLLCFLYIFSLVCFPESLFQSPVSTELWKQSCVADTKAGKIALTSPPV